MSKELIFGRELFDKILVGFNKTANAVGGTLGPAGLNVFLDDPILPHITNDGATIAEAISFPDNYENLGAFLVKNTSSQTNDDAGDGTTTTAVILQDIVRLSLKRPENPMLIRKSLQDALVGIINDLKVSAKPITIDEARKIALISSESEELADIVSDTVKKVGAKGVIVVEESKTFETSVDVQEGYECNNGFISPYFANDPLQTKAVYDNIPVLCSEKKINTIQDIKPLFDQMEAAGKREIVIVCSDIDPQLVGILVANKIQGRLGVVVIKVVGTQLEDICATVGATMISDITGVSFDKLDITKHLGLAQRISSDTKKTLFVAKTESGAALAARLKEEAELNTNEYQKNEILKRIAKLTGGIAIIKIGGQTDSERIYKKHKADDTVAAVKAALEEGVVEGGGMALWRISNNLVPKTIGEEILKEALTAPLRKICENAGKDYAELILKMPAGQGYDFKNNCYTNLLENGIIDPVKVERVSLSNAVFNASNFITVHCVITNAKITKQE
jgi:chaperonin GroEL